MSNAWYVLPVVLVGNGDVNVDVALRKWWARGNTAAEQERIPSDAVAFVDIGIKDVGMLACPTTAIPLSFADLEQDWRIDARETPYIVFYSIVPSSSSAVIHVMGAYPAEEARLYMNDECEDPLSLGDLLRHKWCSELRGRLPNSGVVSTKSTWFLLPTKHVDKLEQLHDGEFDLSSDEGRHAELASFWALAFACGHELSLWDMWSSWERRLLLFRVKK